MWNLSSGVVRGIGGQGIDHGCGPVGSDAEVASRAEAEASIVVGLAEEHDEWFLLTSVGDPLGGRHELAANATTLLQRDHA